MNLYPSLISRPLMSNAFGDPTQTRAMTNPSITAPLTSRSVTSSSSANNCQGQTPDESRNHTSGNQQTRMETGRQQKTTKAQAKAQAQAEIKAQSETGQSQPITTLMIRNIPRQCSQDELAAELCATFGRSDIIDFFYIPWERISNINRGYAFVNFVDVETARMALESLVGYKFKSEPDYIACVAPARMQGLEGNMRFYLSRAVGNRNHPCAPLVMCNGALTELSSSQFDSYREDGKMSDVLEAFNLHGSESSPGDDNLRTCEATGQGKGNMSTWKGEGKGAGKSSENWVATSGNISQLPTCGSESDLLPMISSLESLPSMGSIPELSLAHTNSLTSSFPFSRMSTVSFPVVETLSGMSTVSTRNLGEISTVDGAETIDIVIDTTHEDVLSRLVQKIGNLGEISTVDGAEAIDIVIETRHEDVLSRLVQKFGTPEKAGTANPFGHPEPQDASTFPFAYRFSV